MCRSGAELTTIGENLERRTEHRIHLPFLARVRGVDAKGKSFVVDVQIDNLSSGGLFLRLPFMVNPGARLSAVIRLSTSRNDSAPKVAAKGLVLRVEPKPEDLYGLGVSFIKYEYLQA